MIRLYFNEIRGLIYGYLMGSINLAQFAERFAPLFCDIEDCNDAEAIQLSYQVETILAKASEGFVSEDQVRETLYQGAGSFAPTIQVAEGYRDSSVVRVSQVDTYSDYVPAQLLSKP